MTGSGHTHSCPHHTDKHSTQSNGKRSEHNNLKPSRILIIISLSLLLLLLARANFLPVSQRPRHSPYPMLKVDEALDLILSNTHRKPAKEATVDASMYHN